MIISRTPFRISFFGGGTDYPAWYLQHGGAVLSTTIDKYCYISCRYLPPFFDYRSRIVYSTIELVKDHSDIQHAAVRAVLEHLDFNEGVEIHYHADLPARTGMGTSSSFTVGLLHALYALKGAMPTRMQLAREALHIEQDLLKENVGAQDQMAAAFGGLNRINFSQSGEIEVVPVVIRQERIAELEQHLMLVFTGLSRNATDIAEDQIRAIPSRQTELLAMHQMVDEAMSILTGDGDIEEFGKLLHEGWQLKRSLTDRITSPVIDDMYEAARSAGAIGGKLLGAGGGGFALFFVRPQDRGRVRARLEGLLHVPFALTNTRSQIIMYEPDVTPSGIQFQP